VVVLSCKSDLTEDRFRGGRLGSRNCCASAGSQARIPWTKLPLSQVPTPFRLRDLLPRMLHERCQRVSFRPVSDKPRRFTGFSVAEPNSVNRKYPQAEV